MAGTEIRRPSESGKCDDDSPPVCLVHLNTSRLFQEISNENAEERRSSSKLLIGADEPSKSTTPLSPSVLNESPEVSRMGNSTPDKLPAENTTSDIPIEDQNNTGNVESSFEDFNEQSGSIDIELRQKTEMEKRSLDAFPSTPLPHCQELINSEDDTSNIPVTAATFTPSAGDQVHANGSQPDETKMTTEGLPSPPHVNMSGDTELNTTELEDELDDFEDRPLTVDVPLEPDVEAPVSSASVSVRHTPTKCSFIDSINNVPGKTCDMATKTDQIIPPLDVTMTPMELITNTEILPCSSPHPIENDVSHSDLTERESPSRIDKSDVDVTTVTETESTFDSLSCPDISHKQNSSNVEGIAIEDSCSTTCSSAIIACHLTPSETNSIILNVVPSPALETSSPSAPEPSIPDRASKIHPATVATTTTTSTATTTQLFSPTGLPIVVVTTVIPTSSCGSISATSPSLSTTTATTTTMSSTTSPLSLASQSTAPLMPFMATVSSALPGSNTVLGNLASSAGGGGSVVVGGGGSGCIPTAIPLAGAPGTGPGSLQIFNMAPMPQFVGAPGIVLHATGPVAGNPGFQTSAPLLPGLPSVGAPPGLGGNNTNTLNYLQPQPFATTLLPHSGGTAGDYLIDPQNALGLAQSPFPSSSIALFNPMNPGAVMESMATAPLSTMYPTFIPPHPPTPTYSQSMLSASIAASASGASTSPSLFVSPPPSYRPSGGVTSLVNATTPQMATSLGTGPSPSSFSSLSSMSFGASTPGGFLFQTANHPFISSGPLLQSCQFPSYPVPFHNPDQCLPFTSTLPSNLSGFRPTDQSIETPVSSSTSSSLPQLWAASSSPFSSIPFCQTSFQPLTFPPTTTVTTTVSPPTGGCVSGGGMANLLPQPPTLQPCPALSKRLHRLCPVPISRCTTPTTNASPGLLHSSVRRSPALAVRQPLFASASVADKRPMLASCPTATIGTLPKQIQSTPCLGVKLVNTLSNVGIRTPNSITVIPSLRRRRPPARISSRPISKTEEVITTTVYSTHSPCTTVTSSTPTSVAVHTITIPTCMSEPSENKAPAQTPSCPVVRQTSTPSSPSAPRVVTLDTNAPMQICSGSVSLDQRLPGVHVFPNQTSSTDPNLQTAISQTEAIATITDSKSPPPRPIFDTPDKNERSPERSTVDACTHIPISKGTTDSIGSTATPSQSQSTTIKEVSLPCDHPAPETFTSSSSPSSNSSCILSNSLIPGNSHKTPSPSLSPVRLSDIPNGIQMRYSSELQASLERLDVSSVAIPASSPVTITTSASAITSMDSCLPRSSPRDATDSLSLKLNKSVTAPVHDTRSAVHLPPPVLHHGPDDRRILTHYIDGHVIYESNKPFPVKHGMAVVEAALLHQCIEEEQGYVGRTSRPRHSHHRSPVSVSVNGEEPMQVDPSSAVSPSSSGSGRSFANDKSATKARAVRKCEFPENRPTTKREQQHQKSSPRVFQENGYSADRTVFPCEPSSDRLLGINKKDKSEPSTYPRPHSDHGDNDLGRTKSLTEPTLPSVAPLPSPSFETPRADRQSLDSQQLSSRIPVSTTMPTFLPAQAPISNTHPVSTSATQSFSGIFSYHSHPGLQVPDPPPPGPVRYWSSEDVVAFVRGTPGCGAYADAFLTNEIDGEALLLLAEDQFIQPPIGMKIGPALKLAARLETLRSVR